MKTPALLLFAVGLAYGNLNAQDASILVSCETAKIEVVRASDGADLNDLSKTNKEGKEITILTASLQTNSDQWQPLGISFKSPEETDVVLQLRAKPGNKDSRTCFDNFKIEGATMVNADLEDVDKAGVPKGWRVGYKTRDVIPSKEQADRASSGIRFVEVDSSFFLSQTIHIPKDKEVTITGQVRSAD
ncbi:hypothetical protein BH09VER1_BH09VER1_07590 [soil metagenome]